ncbi:MAG TPA: glycine cleavage system aminomethyltransferase GcvT [Candidatus Dormibacteraeota bacterium]|jgi:aminomethyltransferase|nr:glycine cleavage system aminomethyltransferase GcvT [Candidatus Dormibacteraeota bacterium]
MTVLRTPLFDLHVARGGQMVEFGGWEMPLQYTSMRDEHSAVRQRVGVFDVSHMGELAIRGEGATDALDRIVTNAIRDMEVHQARYTCVCAEDGGIVDDALVYREEWGWMVVVNAGTRLGDLEHFRRLAGADCEIEDLTMRTALIAVQGPRAVETVQEMADIDLEPIPYYNFALGAFDGVPCRFSRTGYTGEDGFELFVPWVAAAQVWEGVLTAGGPHGILPCGLGARDTLRLEAAMRLYGLDITRQTNPLEAGLGWVVKLDPAGERLGKGDFEGAAALRRIKAEGIGRTFVGLELEGRAIARHGYPILDGGRAVGEVTSGTFSFTLGKAVAAGYVEVGSRDSAALAVEVRGEPVPARRVPLPFYKRATSR